MKIQRSKLLEILQELKDLREENARLKKKYREAERGRLEEDGKKKYYMSFLYRRLEEETNRLRSVAERLSTYERKK